MNKREYAISLGLAKPGRGRLSREAHAAIDKAIADGMTFDDAVKATPKPAVIVSTGIPMRPVGKPIKAQTIKRFVRTYVLTTKAGQIIYFGNCALCKNAIMFCGCQKGPYYPDWIKDDVETWLPSDDVLELTP